MTKSQKVKLASGTAHRATLGAALGALCLYAAAAAPAAAAVVPFQDRTVQITAREQPIGQFLQNFYGQIGLPVVVSPSVTGTVNGAFNGPATRINSDISRAFDLVSYFDGSTVYVYQTSELTSRTLTAQPEDVSRVQTAVRDANLTDSRDTLRAQGTVLVAAGTRRFIQQVEDLAAGQSQAVRGRQFANGRLEPPTAPNLEYKVFYLRYAWAEDVNLTVGQRQVAIPGVASILRSLVSNDPNGPAGVAAQTTSRVLPAAVQGLRGQGLARLGTPNPAGPDYADPAAGAAGGAAADGQGTLLANEQVANVTPTPTRIQADSRLNAIIVRDVRERMPAYDQLIAALDVEPQLLEIEAAIIDINTTKARELGINWRFGWDNGSVLFGRGADAPGNVSDRRLGRGRNVNPSGQGLSIGSVIGDDVFFASRLNALETEGVARVVSRPQIVTLSNVEAVFENSRDFYVRLQGERDVDLFNVTSGTTLRVTPHVTRDANQTRIRLLVNIEDGSITDNRVDKIPVVARAALNTQAVIAEGQSLLLGGMTVQSDVDTTSRVPVLGNIPVLGLLFKNQRKESSHTERLFLITPRLSVVGGATAVKAGVRYDAPVPGVENTPLPSAPELPSKTASRPKAAVVAAPPPPPPVTAMQPIPNPPRRR